MYKSITCSKLCACWRSFPVFSPVIKKKKKRRKEIAQKYPFLQTSAYSLNVFAKNEHNNIFWRILSRYMNIFCMGKLYFNHLFFFSWCKSPFFVFVFILLFFNVFYYFVSAWCAFFYLGQLLVVCYFKLPVIVHGKQYRLPLLHQNHLFWCSMTSMIGLLTIS